MIHINRLKERWSQSVVRVVTALSVLCLLAGLYFVTNKSSDSQPLMKEVATYDYAVAVIDSLGYANEAKDLLVEITEAKSTENIYADTMDSLVVTRKAVNKLRQAANTLDSYASTTDPLMSENAQHYRDIYRALGGLLESSAVESERLLTIQTDAEAAAFLSRQSKLTVALDETWKLLPLATAELSHLLVDSERLVDGKVMYLKLTREERSNLTKRLDDVFGSEISDGLKAGQLAATATGALLREFLIGDWLSSDE